MSVPSQSGSGSSGAPQGGGAAAPAAGGQQGSGDGGTPDVQALLAQHRHALEQQSSLYGETSQELTQLKKDHAGTKAMLDGIKKAITGEEAEAPDPYDVKIKHYEGLIDQYLGAAIEAERAGKPIPLTVQNALESFKGQIDLLQENKRVTKELATLKDAVEKATDPSRAVDQTAFSSMDSLLINGLNTVYGATDDMEPVKRSQFRAVAQTINTEIQRLQQEEPHMWDRIRRHPEDQRKLVNHFIRQAIPPRARELMEEDQVRRTPMTDAQLKQAFREARGIEDPQTKEATRTQIRQQLLERMVGGKRGGAINDLYRGD
jgi:hypothetical protein